MIDNKEQLLLEEFTKLQTNLNENLNQICQFGYEITVKVTPMDKSSSRSFKRPLIEIELKNHLSSQG